MRIATWNVNSVKQRIDNLTAWLAERAPDIVCLQETKTVDEAFPRQAIEALGYNVAVHGQKTFNGVAILSKLKFDEVTPRLPGDSASSSTTVRSDQAPGVGAGRARGRTRLLSTTAGRPSSANETRATMMKRWRSRHCRTRSAPTAEA